MAPWDLARQPVTWLSWALDAEAAENGAKAIAMNRPHGKPAAKFERPELPGMEAVGSGTSFAW